MELKWQLTGLFTTMAGLAILLFWVGESALGSAPIRVDLGVVSLALLLPGIIIFFYTYRLAQRLKTLRLTTQRIARGDFNIGFPDSSDELGLFLGELNRLARQVEVIIQQGTREAQKMEAILTGMQEGIVALDHVGRILLVNAAAEKIFGRSQEHVKLKYLMELVRNPELDSLVSGVLGGNPSGIIELNIGQRIVRIQVSPILGETGRPGGAVLVSFDITELRHLEKVRTEFVANVSHELRTPLTSIKGFVETLLDGAAENPAFRDRFLNVIQAETLRLQRLIDDLLTLSHIENREHRRGEVTSGLCFVQEAYRKIQPVIYRYAEAKGLELMVELPEDLPAVPISEDLLSQVLLNLLENAVKYTAEGKIWLRGKADESKVYLEFGDTGCGIPVESLPRIFERFYRVDKARSREQGGTGLGLSIVKHIVEGCGGIIRVSSQFGKGTVFTCELPRTDECSGG